MWVRALNYGIICFWIAKIFLWKLSVAFQLRTKVWAKLESNLELTIFYPFYENCSVCICPPKRCIPGWYTPCDDCEFAGGHCENGGGILAGSK